MTQAENARQPWPGERRSISAALLRDYIEDIAGPIFFVAGPPGLVAAVTEAVLAAGADPAHVRAEEFAGYEKPHVEASSAAGPSRASFVMVAQQADLAPGQVKAVAVNGRQIVLCNVAGRYYALADECPHAGGLLSEGELVGQSIICPLHGAAFDVATGAVLEPPADEGVPCYAVRAVGGAIEVEI